MTQENLKSLRLRYGKTLAECGSALNITAEGYRLKELGLSPLNGAELAVLADLFEMPLNEAFPGYAPTPGELSLCRHLARAA